MSTADGQKVSKIDQKRQQIYQERLQRHVGNGMTLEQAAEAVAREDYERLPVEKKLERMNNGFGAAMQQLGGEMQHLYQNDAILSDAMDANFRALAKLLDRLGISRDDQLKALKEAEAEIIEERKARQEKAKLEAEKRQSEAIVAAAEQTGGAPAEPPADATVFGG